MIKFISIRNFAIIEHTEIEFHDGLNIVTGETGAGKSIVIEAVSLALGSRADTAFVRSGADKAVIQMVAEDPSGREYILSREISAAGRNICRIDDEIVTLAQLSALSRQLADIHGQYDHQSLLDPANHIRLLDSYESDAIGPAKDSVALLYGQYTDLRRQLNQLLKTAAEDRRQRDFMAFELQELEDADLQAGEAEELEQEIRLLQNSESIFSSLSGAYEIISESDYPVLSALKVASDQVSSTEEFSADLEDLTRRLSSLYYELEDISSELRRQRDGITFSPEDLDRKLARLDLLSRLMNKHGKSVEELIEYREELSQRLEIINDISGRQAALENEIRKAGIALRGACNRLSDARRSAAASLEEKISHELAQLNFGDSQFSIDFRETEDFTEEGTDIVEFMISTNRGEPLKPLSKIASGGEMSRIMLAFKKIIGDYDGIPTMIFDEIDAGISGIAATVVGRKMREISQTHQIICITHLPQIAAFGDHHYRIQKTSDETATYTSVVLLDEEATASEIARLLGGETITETTLASARELLDASRQES
ncbi:MAG: DNA repair protein RecN [Firmicutes bacterium]|nr:DNA repair protein RecN [Bacillota bacterium]